MRRWLFNITLVISLAALAILAMGIFRPPELVIETNYPNATPPILRQCELLLSEGRLHIIINDFQPGMGVNFPFGRHFLWIWQWNLLPRLDGHAISGFEAHYLPRPSYIKGETVYFIACPIWFLMVPFLIAPGWWFWKWRKWRAMRADSSTAFPVELDR